MSAREDTKAAKAETARRYGEWTLAEMRERHWNQAMLVRRSGLPKQTVSTILAQEMKQPTVAQVAGLARAFRVDPNEIFSAVGAWLDREKPQAADDAPAVTLFGLDEPARRVAVQLGRALLEMQEAYRAEAPAPGIAELEDIPGEPEIAEDEIQRGIRSGEMAAQEPTADDEGARRLREMIDRDEEPA